MADRIEREIDEILRKIEDFIPEGSRPRRPARKVNHGFANAQGWLGRTLSRVSLNQVMLWSLVLFIGAFFLRAVPGASWVMVGTLIVFGTAFVLSLRAPRGQPRTGEKRWRGQPIDDSGPRWPDRFKAWLKGRRKA